MGAEGASLGAALSGIAGPIGALTGTIATFINPETIGMGLDIFNGAKGMIDQGKQMVEKIIGYITQAT
jgi:hypothetical protein